MTLRAALLTTLVVGAALSAWSNVASAQGKTRPRAGTTRRPARAETIRAEYAAVLLQTQRYDEAVTEYRRLITADTGNSAYRLGLARALAWGGHPRDAEPILARLARGPRPDPAVAPLLIQVRVAMTPTVAEALGWVRESPRNATYRLELARAYVRARQFPPAFAAFDTALAAGETLPLLREAAGAHAAARDSIGNLRLLRRAVALAGFDLGLRRDYAAALTWSGDRRGAIAEYTDLLRRSPNDPDLLLLRGRLYAWSGDYPAAERDLRQSLSIRRSREVYALLGDVYRWRGDSRHAREAYAAALALAPGDSTALAGLAALDQSRPGVVALGISPDVGWTAQFAHSEDNAGFLYLAGGVGRGFALGRGTSVGIGAEQRRISARSSRAPERYVYGFAGSARIAHQFEHLGVSAMGGLAKHGVVRDIPFGDFRIAAGFRSSSLTASVSSGPVYLPLVSAQTLIQFNNDGVVSTTPLIGRTAQVGGSTPVGAFTLSANADLTSLSDGNHRTSAYLGAAYPIAPGLSLLYSGFALAYSARSTRYWDPTIYSSHSVGAQYAWRGNGPLSLTARVLSGVGRATERFATRDGSLVQATGRAALQLSGGGELTYRRNSWDVAATAGYSRGREGEYQSLNSSLRLRLMP